MLLELSPAQVYRLIATFRENPVAGSLVVMRPGPKKGARLLPCDVEQRIEQAINDIYMTRERPTMAKLLAARSAQGLHGCGSEAAVAHGNPGSRVGALAQGDGEGKGRLSGCALALRTGSPQACVRESPLDVVQIGPHPAKTSRTAA